MPGVGDCSICIYDPENNQKCPGYSGIQLKEEQMPLLHRLSDFDQIVWIDAGHGGKDDGAEYGFLSEDNVNLGIAFYLDYEFRFVGIETCMTRMKDEYVSLEQRVTEANIKKADLFISIHCDAFHKKTARGMTVHIAENHSQKALILAKAIDRQLRLQFPEHQHRGIKKSNFYVLTKTKMPAVLIECEFLSNPETRNFLRKAENQRSLAKTICEGVNAAINLKQMAASSKNLETAG